MKRRILFYATCALASLTLPLRATHAQSPTYRQIVIPTKPTTLFNGKDWTGWYTYLPSQGRNKDAEAIFTILPDGIIRVLGKEAGYFATSSDYAYYKLTFEVKWGEKRWPPRETVARDSGVLVHFIGEDKVWPLSFECQIQENDFGDIFHIDGMSSRQVPGGPRNDGRVVRAKLNEKPRGEWNTVTVIVDGDHITNIINGVVESEGIDCRRGRTDDSGKLNFGRIVFQSEWAEVYYRNIKIEPIL
jgi:hypothetical protein